MKFSNLILNPLVILIISQANVFAQDNLIQLNNKASIFFVLPILLLGAFLLFIGKVTHEKKAKKEIGFLSITPHKKQRFFPLDNTVQNMIPVVGELADETTNVYSNLSKIILTIKSNSVFIEDKNYKISTLINRRRSRRCYLYDGDIIDMGELTLMFVSPFQKQTRHDSKGMSGDHIIPRARRTHGKIIKDSPILLPLDMRKKTFYLTKNVTFIGRSEMNDLLPKSKAVAPMHARIEKIADRYKIVDLHSQGGTFINGRRIESKFLRDGDEVSFESVKYLFYASGKEF